MMGHFPFKLAAVDLDDTLLGYDKRVGHANRGALERLQRLGCEVILASGRRHDNILPFYRELGLNGYVVSCQGASARHARTGQFLHHAPLDPGLTAELINAGLERRVTVMYWSSQGIGASERSPWVQRYEADCRDPVPVTDVLSMLHKPAEKVVWGAEPPLIASLAPQLRRRYEGRLNVTVTDDWFIEFTSLGATKAAGVAAVARAVGVAREHVLAFGDGNNDVPMLEWAAMGVAMSHARPAARAAARLVAPDGDPETSFARAVEGVINAALGGSPRTARHRAPKHRSAPAISAVTARWAAPAALPR